MDSTSTTTVSKNIMDKNSGNLVNVVDNTEVGCSGRMTTDPENSPEVPIIAEREELSTCPETIGLVTENPIRCAYLSNRIEGTNVSNTDSAASKNIIDKNSANLVYVVDNPEVGCSGRMTTDPESSPEVPIVDEREALNTCPETIGLVTENPIRCAYLSNRIEGTNVSNTDSAASKNIIDKNSGNLVNFVDNHEVGCSVRRTTKLENSHEVTIIAEREAINTYPETIGLVTESQTGSNYLTNRIEEPHSSKTDSAEGPKVSNMEEGANMTKAHSQSVRAAHETSAINNRHVPTTCLKNQKVREVKRRTSLGIKYKQISVAGSLKVAHLSRRSFLRNEEDTITNETDCPVKESIAAETLAVNTKNSPSTLSTSQQTREETPRNSREIKQNHNRKLSKLISTANLIVPGLTSLRGEEGTIKNETDCSEKDSIAAETSGANIPNTHSTRSISQQNPEEKPRNSLGIKNKQIRKISKLISTAKIIRARLSSRSTSFKNEDVTTTTEGHCSEKASIAVETRSACQRVQEKRKNSLGLRYKPIAKNSKVSTVAKRLRPRYPSLRTLQAAKTAEDFCPNYSAKHKEWCRKETAKDAKFSENKINYFDQTNKEEPSPNQNSSVVAPKPSPENKSHQENIGKFNLEFHLFLEKFAKDNPTMGTQEVIKKARKIYKKLPPAEKEKWSITSSTQPNSILPSYSVGNCTPNAAEPITGSLDTATPSVPQQRSFRPICCSNSKSFEEDFGPCSISQVNQNSGTQVEQRESKQTTMDETNHATDNRVPSLAPLASLGASNSPCSRPASTPCVSTPPKRNRAPFKRNSRGFQAFAKCFVTNYVKNKNQEVKNIFKMLPDLVKLQWAQKEFFHNMEARLRREM